MITTTTAPEDGYMFKINLFVYCQFLIIEIVHNVLVHEHYQTIIELVHNVLVHEHYQTIIDLNKNYNAYSG
jgi:hypothetical protein